MIWQRRRTVFRTAAAAGGFAFIIWHAITLRPLAAQVHADGAPPRLRIVAAGFASETRPHGWGISFLEMPSAVLRLRIGSDVVMFGAISSGAARDHTLAAPLRSDRSSACTLARWNVERNGSVTREAAVKVGSVTIAAVTSSPGGRYTAFANLGGHAAVVRLLDWKDKSARTVATLPDDLRKGVGLACSDDGYVYSWPIGAAGVPDKVTLHSGRGTPKAAGSYDAVVTNKTGAFGVRGSASREYVRIVLRQLGAGSSPEQVYEATVAGATAAGFYACSGDGRFWMASVRKGKNAAALVVWRRGQPRPVYVVDDPRMKTLIPLGISVE